MKEGEIIILKNKKEKIDKNFKEFIDLYNNKFEPVIRDRDIISAGFFYGLLEGFKYDISKEEYENNAFRLLISSEKNDYVIKYEKLIGYKIESINYRITGFELYGGKREMQLKI